ncbi:MAG: T9SS C-terminal target domain-containing protein, partial [Chitinophagia bacterium]|nr:T9SS C-terminal target domain-containing protein [Chitinophagia bacterium]
DGVRFEGCRFTNRDTGSLNAWHDGIFSTNSSFIVTKYGTRRSRFYGFRYAINMRNAYGTNFTTAINRTDFDTNGVGIFIDAQPSVHVAECSFRIGQGIPVTDVATSDFDGCHQNIGIFQRNSLFFTIEGNKFKGLQTPLGYSHFYTFGVVVANEPENNVIYRNKFDSLKVAAYGVGQDNAYGYAGLRVACDTFLYNYQDIAASTDGGSPPQGIYPDQNGSQAAGNIFGTSTYHIVNGNGCRPIHYYYDAGVTGAQPTSLLALTPTWSVLYLTVNPTTNTTTCPATYPGGSSPDLVALNPSTLASQKTTFNTARKAGNDSGVIYRAKIDFGNTDSLITYARTTADTAGLITTMAACAPWASTEVLDSVAATHKLNYAQQLEMFVANPDNWSDGTYLAYMAAKYTLLPDDVTSLQILAPNNRRTKLTNSLMDNSQKMDAAARKVLLAMGAPVNPSVSVSDTTGLGICTDPTSIYYLLDSNKTYGTPDSTDAFLKRVDRMWAVYYRARLAYTRGKYGYADTIMATVDSMATLYNADQTEKGDWQNLWSVLYTAAQNGRDMYHLTSADVAGINNVGTNPVFTGNAARPIEYYTGTPSGPDRPLPFFLPCLVVYESGGKPGHSTTESQNAAPEVLLSGRTCIAYPNPATSQVTFGYSTTAPGGIWLVVTNLHGEKVLDRRNTESNGCIQWDTRNVVPGIYFYQANDANGPIAKAKVVIMK